MFPWRSKNWNVYHPLYTERKVVNDVSFKIHKGEVVGISGLMGAGRTELAMSIFGKSYGTKISGQIFMNGKEVKLNTVKEAIDNKLAYVTEDRKRKRTDPFQIYQDEYISCKYGWCQQRKSN